MTSQIPKTMKAIQVSLGSAPYSQRTVRIIRRLRTLCRSTSLVDLKSSRWLNYLSLNRRTTRH